MSSDSGTTTSSQLRRFGLYRTVDARTEEFLKLSRRRQIRQGCACAAVSTAITVTVVVSVLLVYDYGFHSDAELAQSRHRPRWLSMLNDYNASFDKHLQKTNNNIDTLKLLPILLKAIKQNQYLEQVLDDSQTQEKTEEITDYPFERNVFTDSRKWIRMPTSKLYAIEYKSSPDMFFKRNMDNFAKSSKVMNSQRIMRYIDRMINEKVISYNKKIMPTTPMPKTTSSDFLSKEPRKNITHVKSGEITRTKEKEKSYCKCNIMEDLIKKLMKSIQQVNFLCGSKFKTFTQKSTTVFPTSGTTSDKTVSIADQYHYKFKFSSQSKRTNGIQNMFANINQGSQKDSRNYRNINAQNIHASHEQITTTKTFIEPTTKYFPRRKVKHRVDDHEHFTFKCKGNVNDNKETFVSENPTKKLIENYKITTKNNAAIIKSQTNSHIEPLKTFSTEYQEKGYESGSTFPYFSKSTTNRNNLENNIDYTELKTTTTPENKYVPKVSNINIKQDSDPPEFLLLEHQGNEQDFGEKVYTPVPDPYEDYQPKKRGSTAISQFLHKLEESEKNNYRFIDNFVSKLNGTLKHQSQGSTSDFYPGSLVKGAGSTESLNSLNSIVPKSRSQFLEIRRDTGKHERHDYDVDTSMHNFNYD